MARWFQKKEEELPEKLRGKSEEDLIKALEASEERDTLKTKAAELETARTQLETNLNSQKTELETVKSRLAEIETKGGDQGGKGAERSTGPASIFVNEDQAFRDRMEPMAQQVAIAGSLAARMTAREHIQNQPKIGSTELRIWDKYANEINTLMSKETSGAQINPNSWMNAFIYVKGLHMNELLEARDKKADMFAEPVTGGSNRDEEHGGGNNDKLSPEELTIAKKFGMTPEKYLERKKNMKFVSA